MGSWSFTIRLYPQGIVFIIPHPARFVNPFAEFFIAGIPVAGKVCTRRLNPGGTGSAGVSGARRGLCLLCRLPTLPLACFPAPYPPDPLPRWGRGSPFCFILPGAPPPAPRALNRLRHLQNLPSRYPAKGSLRFCAKMTVTLSFGQCRQPRRGGTGGDGTIRRKRRRRLRWSSPPGQGEPVPHRVQPPLRTPQRQSKQVPQGASPHCVFHSGKDSRCRRRQKPTPLPSFPFPQQSPHKENHAVDERREENRQNNMRENTEPEKADRRNRTRRESRGKHAE